MMIEQNTNYAYKLKYMDKPTCSRFATLPKITIVILCNFAAKL